MALLFLFSCHDAPRDNPLDPALTPPVELQVALDDTAGTATLTWTRYEGPQPFREYWVLRNLADRKTVDTLAHLPTQTQTAFVDTTLAPNTAYGYRVEVVNRSGHGFPSEEKSVTGYAAGPVALVEVEVDQARGQAQLRWTRFQGGHFGAYRVERRSGEEVVFQVIGWLAGVQDTVYVDDGVNPEVSYFYRVVVEAGGQEWPSAPSSRQHFSLAPVELGLIGPAPGLEGLALTWGRFGGPDFQAYQVRRRAVGTDQEVVVAELSAATDTSLVDTTALAGVDYLYTVAVQAAGQELPSNAQGGRLVLPPVEIAQADFNSAEASASLAWTRYRGPRFKAYQVWRRTAELAAQVIAEKPDIADTSLVDMGLLGNTEYFYQVTVLTERDEEVKSEEKGKAFHQLLVTWPIAAEALLFVRLYREEEGVSALVYEPRSGQLKLLVFDQEGRLQEGQVRASLGADTQRSIALASGLDGRRVLSVASSYESREVGILAWGADGQQLAQDLPLFGDVFPQPLIGPEGAVLGEIALLGSGYFDNVAVSAQGGLLFSEDFEDFPISSGPVTDLRGVQGWDFSGGGTGGGFWAQQGNLRHASLLGGVAHRADASWQNFRLEADVSASEYAPKIGIRIGGDTFSRLTLWLDRGTQQAILDWSFTPPPDLGLEPRTQRFIAPLGILAGPIYHLGLEMVDGQVKASVRTPLLWGGLRPPGLPWTGLATIGETLALTVYDQPYALTREGEATAFPGFGNGVSEIRAWQDRRGRQQVGVCLPEAGKLLLGFVPGGQEAQWPAFLTRNLGPNIGAQQGLLSYPLSFDVGPDGRIFVLDAGSGRILVFDVNRQYLTQWGRQGSGEGEFSFGEGGQAVGGGLNFAGSIAVDSQGYIYVADEVNRRIQKFAP